MLLETGSLKDNCSPTSITGESKNDPYRIERPRVIFNEVTEMYVCSTCTCLFSEKCTQPSNSSGFMLIPVARITNIIAGSKGITESESGFCD